MKDFQNRLSGILALKNLLQCSLSHSYRSCDKDLFLEARFPSALAKIC